MKKILLFSLFTTWVFGQDQIGSDIDGEAAYDESGISVSIDSDGSHVAIGAKGNDGGGTNAGHVRVYEWNGSAWGQVGSDIDGEATYDQSGISVSIDSDGSNPIEFFRNFHKSPVVCAF